ncbi:MAG: sodium:solute symporter family protein [Prolixibacteraceae bacterium]|jgi:solute:Na+ symporter, SSS family|nr:sodium:solute symporter family protein [Prolixibacteraceae bacterium]MBT6004304.1 sodium:solute symporter family protein [Prolixibacteraceae bacterium]MBT6763600.1 sodium:solute symporter family protein [Prolixibacteraceae bacterium]MBT7000347.1 sodium:solute symporter family protein [Prolixibacteraceae bacterium]MBT7395407.1 sodium:solute symporter family protein [Prolixibacteraceae bacterium]
MLKWLLIVGTIYIAILFYLSWRSRQRNKSNEDFMMAGSNIGLILGFMTFAATLFSTFTLMGMPDFSRTHGIGAWIFLAFSDAGMVFLIVWFGFHLRKQVAQKGFKGMSGLLQSCYKNKWAGYIYFLAVFIFLVPYVAIQIRGVAIFLEQAFPAALPAWGWSLFIVVIMLLYSEFGGLKAIIYADFMQGTMLLIVVWVIAVTCLNYLGGWAEMFTQVEVANAALLSTPGPKGLLNAQFLIASFLAILMIPVTQPQLSTRLVIMKDFKAMRRMAVAVGTFAMLVIFPTIIIGMYGAIRYPDASVPEFLGQVLLRDQPAFIAAAAIIGLFAAAMSTSDSQLFAMGNELRGLLGHKGSDSLLPIRIAIISFAVAALLFSLFSSDQLVLLARISFAGTAMMGPLVILGILSKKPMGWFMVIVSGLGLAAFVLSQAGVLPGMVGPFRMDLFLMVALAIAGFGNYLVRK